MLYDGFEPLSDPHGISVTSYSPDLGGDVSDLNIGGMTELYTMAVKFLFILEIDQMQCCFFNDSKQYLLRNR